MSVRFLSSTSPTIGAAIRRGQYHWPGRCNGGNFGDSGGGTAVPANRLYLIPFWAPKSFTCTHVGFARTNVAETTLGVALYADGHDAYGSCPGTQIYKQTTGISCPNSGYNESALTTPVSIAANTVYWIGFAPNQARDWRILLREQMQPVLGEDPVTLKTYTHLYWNGDGIDNLPAVIPSLSFGNDVDHKLPAICCKITFD